VFAGFTGSAGRSRVINDGSKTIVNAVNLYVSPFGEEKIVLSRHMKSGDTLLFSPEMWERVYLQGRNWFRETLAKVGDKMSMMIVGEFSLKHKNQKGSALVREMADPTPKRLVRNVGGASAPPTTYKETMTKLLETNVDLLEEGGDLGVQYTQDIPDHFVQDIQDRFTGTNDAVATSCSLAPSPLHSQTAGCVKATTSSKSPSRTRSPPEGRELRQVRSDRQEHLTHMNYGELQAQFEGLLKRRDMTPTQSATFLQQAVSRVQRVLRIPPMEKSVSVTYDGVTFQNGELPIPNDYLRLIALTAVTPDGEERELAQGTFRRSSPTRRPLGAPSPSCAVAACGSSDPRH
jgi:hypothetical protein